ncbi:MAG TPA: glycosyltransferase family 2 protein [Candidatus Aquabacterium excrementipullorum]|nr:glycosyltransferase family 2 protein [Candidatus Aquabacterium excrementipullorum]
MIPTIAVVIATYRRPHLLRRCLEALLRQSVPASTFEIVIVDDGRSHDTQQVVEEFARRTQGAPAVRYLQPQGTRGPAGARNRGWRASAAPIIAFTDDDTVPDGHWLREGYRALSRDVVAVGGRLVVPVNAIPTDHERNTQGLERAEFATANAFVWRTALELVGGFDERFQRAWREDSDLHFSLMERAGQVGWAPAAVVVHPVRAEPWGVSLRQQANVFFDALLFKKHPKLYRLKVRPAPPWRYYLIVGAFAVGLLLLVSGQATTGLLAWLVALGGITSLAHQRLRGTLKSPAHVADMVLTSAAIPFLSVYWRVRGALHFKVFFI